jgi:hypothetical protein
VNSTLRSALPGGAAFRAPRLAPACAVCRRPFAFATGEAALILRHVAYGFDFVHEGPCLDAARELLFVEPGYDCQAFGPDPVRRRVLDVADAAGWAAASPETPQRVVAGHPLRFEPLRWWALVEHQDGTRWVEGIIREDEWLDEPGGATLPEARSGRRRSTAYVPLEDSRLERPRAA